MRARHLGEIVVTVAIVVGAGCKGSEPAGPAAPDPGVHVVAPDRASYLIDPASRSCFLLHEGRSLPVSCYYLRENNEEARKAISWIEDPPPRDESEAPPVQPRSPRPSIDPALRAKLEEGIRQVDEHTYEIDTALVAELFEEPAPFLRGARLVPSQRGGKMVGVKLYAVRPSSVYGKLGLKNGDLVEAINGESMATPEAAFDVYRKLKSAREWRVSIQRRGKDLELRYIRR